MDAEMPKPLLHTLLLLEEVLPQHRTIARYRESDVQRKVFTRLRESSGRYSRDFSRESRRVRKIRCWIQRTCSRSCLATGNAASSLSSSSLQGIMVEEMRIHNGARCQRVHISLQSWC